MTPPLNPPIKIATITIDGGPRSVERGTVTKLTATAKDTAGKVVSTPFAWRSSADSIVSIGPDGTMTALQMGSAMVTASALGVSSGNVEIVVVLQGPANASAVGFTVPNAVSPGGDIKDSLHVLVTNTSNVPLAGAHVRFAVTGGGGTVSPTAPVLALTNQSGVASAKWTLGPSVGLNTVTATVMFDSDTTQVNTNVKNNPVTFTVRTYTPLVVLQGDNQTGSVLSALPVVPSVKLVDTAGKPRAGIPVTFAATGNGRVANTVVSTTADGIATPGTWTLGDASGDEQLVVTVEAAKLSLHATATGTTVRLSGASGVTAGQNATCVLTSDQFAMCFGQAPQIGSGDTASRSVPTLTKGSIKFTSLSGHSAHFCGITSDGSLYCWGLDPFVDTTGTSNFALAPTRLPSGLGWVQVAPGGTHNCTLANDNTAYCWGTDGVGQGKFKPTPVAGGFTFTSLTSGLAHSCGIAADASAFCWGSNSSGQLGDGTQTDRLTPTAVKGSLKWKTLGGGSLWTCGLNDTGAAYCWGSGTGVSTPTAFPVPLTFSSLSVGAAHACGLVADGTAYCWGDNSSGQLGDSTVVTRGTPTAVSTTLKFASISAGFEHTCGVTTDGFVACWGRNTFGELGVSTPLIQTTPRYVILEIKP